jgi:hypothetical protein
MTGPPHTHQSCLPFRVGQAHLMLDPGSTLPVFASCPLRGEDNDGFAQRRRREVGVISERPDTWPEVTPSSHGKIDFREERKSSRAVPPRGGGGEKLPPRPCGESICDRPALKGEGATAASQEQESNYQRNGAWTS